MNQWREKRLEMLRNSVLPEIALVAKGSLSLFLFTTANNNSKNRIGAAISLMTNSPRFECTKIFLGAFRPVLLAKLLSAKGLART